MSPYIRQKLRPDLNIPLNMIETVLRKKLATGEITDKELCGCITYCIYKLLIKFYRDGRWYEKMDAEKACKSAVDEFMRRWVHPYEDGAMQHNGDVLSN